MRELTGFVLGTLLLSSVPALASGLALSEPQALTRTSAESISDQKNRCSLELYLENHKSLNQFSQDTAFRPLTADNHWASGATYQWNAGLNRAVDHLFMPPDQVQLRVTQTGDDLRGRYESAVSPNATVAAFQVVIH